MLLRLIFPAVVLFLSTAIPIFAAERPTFSLPDIVIEVENRAELWAMRESVQPTVDQVFLAEDLEEKLRSDVQPAVPDEEQYQGEDAPRGFRLFAANIGSLFGMEKSQFKKGMSKYYKRDFPAAEKLFAKLLNKEKSSLNIRQRTNYWLAQIRIESGKTLQARDYLNDALACAVESSYIDYSRHALGWLDYRDGYYQAAQEHFNRIVIRNRETDLLPIAQFHAAVAFFAGRSFKKAAVAFEKTTGRWPQSEVASQAVFWSAESLYKANKFEDALEGFRKYLQREDKETELAIFAANGAGWSLYAQGDPDAAVGAFDESLAKHPGGQSVIPIRIIYGRLLAEQGKLGEALASFDAARRQDATGKWTARVLRNRGIVQFKAARYEDAIRTFTDTLKLERDAPLGDERNQIRFMVAESLLQIGRIEDAGRYFGRVVDAAESKSLKAKAIYRQGWRLMQLGSYSDARSVFLRMREVGAKSYKLDEILFYIAESYFREKRYEDVRKAYRGLLKEFPQSEWALHARMGVGWTYYQQMNWTKALDCFNRETQRKDMAPEAFVRAAECLINLDRPQQSLEKVKEYFQADESKTWGADACRIAAEAYRAMNEPEKAREKYLVIASDYPDSPEAKSVDKWIGETYFSCGDYDEAAKRLFSYISRTPPCIERCRALVMAGDARYNQGKFAGARDFYNQAADDCAADPLIEEALYNRAMTYFKEGRQDEFRAQVDIYGSRFPDSKFTLVMFQSLGDWLADSGRFEAALDYLSRIAQKGEKGDASANAQMKVGEILLQQGKNVEAIRNFSDIILTYPDKLVAHDARFSIAKAYISAGNHSEAIKQFQLLALECPDSPLLARALYEQARSYEKIKQPDQAIRVYQKLLTRKDAKSVQSETRLRLGYLYADFRKDGNQACKHFRKAALSKKGSIAAPAYYEIGRIYVARAKLKEAIEAYMTIAYLFPGQINEVRNALTAAGECYEALNQPQEAVKVYIKYLDFETDAEKRLKIEAKISLLSGDATPLIPTE